MKSLRMISERSLTLRIARAVALAVAAILLYANYGANLLSLLKLVALCFWLAVLPGVLLAVLFIRKDAKRFETWLLGSALGVNVLPILFTLGGVFTNSAPPLWLGILAIVSVANILGIARYSRNFRSTIRDSEDLTRIPVFPILSLGFIFIGVVLLPQFGRDLNHGLYFLSKFFGGDIGYHSGYVLALEKYTRLVDWHDGGARMYYHDFTHRLIAGLHFFSKGNIFDAYWFFLTGFDTLLLLFWIWLLASKITGSRFAAWIAMLGFFFYPGAQSSLFLYDSSSFRLGIIEAFVALYLVSELFQRPDESGEAEKFAKRVTRGKEILYCAIVALLICWKITDAAVLIPALLLVGLLSGLRTHNWRLLILTTIGASMGAIYAVLAYSPANELVGEDIIGRHFEPLAQFINHHLGTHLHPVMPLSHTTWIGLLQFVAFILPFFIAKLAFSGRYFMALLILPGVKLERTQFPYLKLFLISAVLIGYFFCNLVSRAHYYYGDPYQQIFADTVGLLTLGLVLGSAWKVMRSQGQKSRREIQFLSLAVIALVIEGGNAVVGYRALESSTQYTIGKPLLDDLDSASLRLPENALVATRRFNLNVSVADRALNASSHGLDEDWNFEFYATGLRHSIVTEGPGDPLRGAVATVIPDSDWYVTPNPTLAKEFWKKSAWLDSLYTSKSPANAIAAMDSLSVTHVLIDHTIGQKVIGELAGMCDTAFDSRSITLLRRRPSRP